MNEWNELFPLTWVDEINFCRLICVINDGPYTCYKTEVFFNIYLFENVEIYLPAKNAKLGQKGREGVT